MSLVFLDNDIVSKLAQADLIVEAMAALGATEGDVRILDTFKHRYGLTNPAKRAKREKELGAVVMERIERFQSQVPELELLSPELLLLFEDVQGIDPGEAQLYACASQIDGARVVTGDKTSIRQLAADPKCATIAVRLAGRVVCFEQLVAKAIGTVGFESVKKKVVPAMHCDIGLRAAFGMGLDADELQVLRVLDSYTNELRGQAGIVLSPD